MPKRINHKQHDGELQAQYATGTVKQTADLYTEQDHEIWRELGSRLAGVRPGRAADSYLQALDRLAFGGQVPLFEYLNQQIQEAGSRWQLVAVEGLIRSGEFYEHLAARRFPVSWWIRNPHQLDYIAEPDLFHDLVGHVPMLLDPDYAGTIEAYGKQALRLVDRNSEYGQFLSNLYWFTIEFGLLRQPDGLRAYGAGILSSPQELTWCVDGDPLRLELDPIRAMRQNYRIDEPQGLYFIAQSLHQVRHTLETIKEDDLKRAIDLGGLPIVRWEQATGP